MDNVKNKKSKIIIKIIVSLLLSIAILFFCVSIYKALERKYVYPLKYFSEIEEFSEKYGVEKALILATIKEESGFNKNVKSPKGAIGLMQIMPSTAKFIAKTLNIESYNLYEAKTNVQFGTYYISYLKTKFSSVIALVCAYNAGEGVILGWLNDKELSKDGKTLEKVPYHETNNYIKKIMKSYKKYKKLYPNIVDK